MKPILKIFFCSILPLFLGGMIYILFRSTSLLMFSWFEILGVNSYITLFREHINLPAKFSWIIFSLPDALWVFSFTCMMAIVWQNRLSFQSLLWIFLAPAIGILSELCQALSIVPGTFDYSDLALIIMASFLAIYCTLIKPTNKIYETL